MADARRKAVREIAQIAGLTDEAAGVGKSAHGTQECAMPLSFPTTEHLHRLWSRPPGLQPAPRPAFRGWLALDSARERRFRGTPRRPGVLPLQFCSIRDIAKTKRHCAGVRAPHLPVRRCETIFAPALIHRESWLPVH